MKAAKILLALFMTAVLLPAMADEEDRFAKVQIKTEQVTDNIYVLFGSGGNIGVSVGEDGVFMIDDQYAPLTEKILAAVKKLSDKPVRFVINTHWHGDHTGGNENLGNKGVVIVAHDNVYKRMSKENFIKEFDWKVPAAPKAALPVITFNDSVTFHLNGDDVHAVHYSHSHTDGDSVVHFKKANVIHTGDIWFNGMYPFTDVGSKGNINGMISTAEKIAAMSDDKTVIIPGHGPISNKAGIKEYIKMLKTVRERVQKLIDDGKTLEEVQAMKPNADDYDKTHGGGFINPDTMLKLVYLSLKK